MKARNTRASAWFPAVFMFGIATGLASCLPGGGVDPRVATIAVDTVLDAGELACVLFHEEIQDLPALEEVCHIAPKKRAELAKAKSARNLAKSAKIAHAIPSTAASH